MTDETPANPFDPDDPHGWPVVATAVIHLDPRAGDNAAGHGFCTIIQGDIPQAMASSLLLRQISNAMLRPDFNDGMVWVHEQADDDEGEGERHG